MALQGKISADDVRLLVAAAKRGLDGVQEMFQLPNVYFHLVHLVTRKPEEGLPPPKMLIPSSHEIHNDDCERYEGQCLGVSGGRLEHGMC